MPLTKSSKNSLPTLPDLLVGGCNKRGVDVVRKFPKVGGGNKMGGVVEKGQKKARNLTIH